MFSKSAFPDKSVISDPWFIMEEGIDSVQERETEARLSFSNGYIGSRSSLEEYYYFCDPGTFIAGIYEYGPDQKYNMLALVPDWTRIRIYLEDNLIDVVNNEVLEHKRYIDVKKGLIVREWRSQDPEGRITNIKITKFISLSTRNIAYKGLTIQPENYSGRLKVVSGLDSFFIHQAFPVPAVEDEKNHIVVGMKADNDKKQVIMAQKSNFSNSNLNPLSLKSGQPGYTQEYTDQFLYESWEWLAEYGQKYNIESIISVFSNVDVESPLNACREYLNNIREGFIKNHFLDHTTAWENWWKDTGLFITGDDFAQKSVNFSLYHLISAGEFSGNNVSIPARGLTGAAYLGHVFWDTEMYMLPFFIFTKPDIARALLMYRYNTLQGARINAQRDGFKGVSFAWESTDTGVEMTPTEAISPYGQVIKIYSGKYENHITPDIAYAVCQYWQATGDLEFILNYGAEIIFESARYSCSLLKEDKDGFYHIYNVVGPDEYHDMVDDNTYTNIMGQNNIEMAIQLYEFVKTDHKDICCRLKNKINLKEEELEGWKKVRDKIYINYNGQTRLFEQFTGYFDLDCVDLKQYEPRILPMDVILGRETIRKSQVIKQADVLMFLFLLRNKFSKDVIKANYNYYEPRTSHGSSLSPSIHGILAAYLGKSKDAYDYFIKNAEIDLNNNMGNASVGIHMAAAGGTWMTVVMGFMGMQMYDKGLSFDPNLPEQWNALDFSIYWHGQKIIIHADEEKISFNVTGNNKVNINIGCDNWKELSPNNIYYAFQSDSQWYWQ